MCGLFGGASSTLVDSEVERIIQLGIVSQLRGVDSTGILSCYREGGRSHAIIHKDVVTSTEFFGDKEIGDFLGSKKPFIIAGHCRAATIGNVTKDNAHPYDLGRIRGMKNGTVANVRGRQEGETDTKALLRILQEEGVQAVVDEAQYGGYAMVWVDIKEGTLNFLRNSGRPLWFMVTPGAIYWASEKEMLALVRNRTGINWASTIIEECPPETHVILPANNILHGRKDVKMSPTKKNWALFERKATNIGTSMGPPRPDSCAPRLLPRPSTSVPSVPLTENGKALLNVSNYATEEKKEKPKLRKGENFRILAYAGKPLKQPKARKLFAKGCAFCDRTLTLGEAEEAHFFNNNAWLCSRHADDAFARLNVGAKELYKCQIIMGETHGNC